MAVPGETWEGLHAAKGTDLLPTLSQHRVNGWLNCGLVWRVMAISIRNQRNRDGRHAARGPQTTKGRFPLRAVGRITPPAGNFGAVRREGDLDSNIMLW